MRVAGGDEFVAFQFRYRAESREVERIGRCYKREFAFELFRETKEAAERNDYRSLREKPITKELAFGRKTFDGPTKDINARLFFHGDKQLKR